MGRFGLQLDLVDPVILTGGAAAGDPDGLPGSLVLGAAAAALYRRLSRDQSWLLFHSGKVRFGNGRPLGPGGAAAWPVPACWNLPPDALPATGSGILNRDRVVNRLHAPDGRATAWPEGSVTESGWYLRPRLCLPGGLATAPGGHGLAEGQSFLADIDWDEDLPKTLIDRLQAFFEETEILLLGRSRSAQYGRVACRRVPPPPWPRSLERPGRELSFWLLSDLAACDEQGFPTLAPMAEALGLPPAEPVVEKTFARFRTYSPFNAFHGLHGQERQVIARGSVLTFRCRDPLPAGSSERLAAVLERGLGRHRECGLGRVAPAPALLAGRHPEFLPTAAGAAAPAPTPPDHPLVRWLRSVTESHSTQGGMKRWAEDALREFEQLERNARRLNGLREDQSAAPGKSQWGRVLQAAERAARAPDAQTRLQRELFAGENAVCGGQDEDWARPTVTDEGQQLSYREWLRRKLSDFPGEGPRALAVLAGLALRRSGARD